MTADPFELNLRHLRAIPAIIARGSMSAAANAVNLSQPALTQGIAKLERQIARPLFSRTVRGMAATTAGLLLADRANAAFAHLAAGFRGIGRARGFARPEHLVTGAQARGFLALADGGSFVGAAARTGLSEPAIHRAVRDLEQVGGVALLERRGRGVVLTEAGRKIGRGIRLAAADLAAALAELAEEEPGAGRITIGAMPLCRARVLPRAIARLAREAPGTVIDVIEGSWRELVEPLRDGVIDLMIGALREEAAVPGLVQASLFEDRLAVIGRAGHPLSAEAHPSLDRLASFPWIVGAPGTPLRAHWETVFAGRSLPPHPIECGSVITIRGVLADSDFLTLLSPDQVALELAGGLLAALGPPPATGVRIIGVTTRAGWRPTRWQARFLALLQEVVHELSVQENK